LFSVQPPSAEWNSAFTSDVPLSRTTPGVWAIAVFVALVSARLPR
jgi:hypothetical protein